MGSPCSEKGIPRISASPQSPPQEGEPNLRLNRRCFQALPHLLICSGILGSVLDLSLDEVLFYFCFWHVGS